MRRALFIPLLAILVSCSTFPNIEQGLQSMVGRPRAEAFSRLGYPSSQLQFGSDTAYVWGASNTVAVPVPQSNSTSGYVGSTPFNATTTSTGYMPMTYSCTIRIIVGPDDLVKSWDYNGNLGGCSRYASLLKPR